MPKRTDIESIMIIGAGPIVIGQACEFDYSGAQACKALRQEGYRVILVNSNPATIMTDPDLADATYIEPITPDFVEKIIIREKANVPKGRIFALLRTMGGRPVLMQRYPHGAGGPSFFLHGTVSGNRMGGTSPPDSEGPGATWELVRQ